MSISTAERLPAGDQAAPAISTARTTPEHDDRADVEPELLAVVRLERRVDHVLRDPDERDLRRPATRPPGRSRRSARPCTAAGTRAAGRTCRDSGVFRASFQSSASGGLADVRELVRGSARRLGRPAPRFAGIVEPAARAGRVGQRDRDRVVSSKRCRRTRSRSSSPSRRASGEAADRHDQPRPEQPSSQSRQNAQSSCSRGVGVRSPRPLRRPARIAARDRGAVEGRVELSSSSSSQRRSVRPARPRHGRRSSPSTTPGAWPNMYARWPCVRLRRPAATRAGSRPRRRRGNAVVALERRERAVARAPAGQARTATNQRPAKTVSPPPSSAASASRRRSSA